VVVQVCYKNILLNINKYLKGVSLPLMGTGFNRGLLSDTVFEAHKIYKMNKSEVENDQELTEEEIEEIKSGDYYHKLATVRISIIFLSKYFNCQF